MCLFKEYRITYIEKKIQMEIELTEVVDECNRHFHDKKIDF